MLQSRAVLATVLLLIVGAPARPLVAQQVDPALLQGLQWRGIGPHRGGRTKAAVGVPGRPNVFYIGVVNGGVFKTTDYGRTWNPIFDDQPTGSIGAIAVAPSNPDIIYVGSGEGLQRPDLSTGDGIYRSADGGTTWKHLGLRDGQQIPQIVVDPRNPDRLFVAVEGHPYGPNDERGLFLSTDGGETFRKVLYKDENTGAIDVVLDPRNPDVIYAALWEARQAPWENGAFDGPGTGLYKSTDGGTTWRQLTTGLPTWEKDGLGRMGIAVAPSDPNRLYLTVDLRNGGYLYRSDDAGETWQRASGDPRVVSRASDFAEVKVHPTNPDIIFTASVVTWKSTDGGKTFAALRGAPGGDDYHRIWINPDNPEIILIAADQGAIITVNGGASWSSWYNQSSAQFYHVSTDNAFPYRVCGGQQESGSACVASRGNDGQITFREWHPVSVEEYGYVAPDPLDPDVVYGGKLTRYDRRTGQVQEVAPKLFRGPDYRALRTAPVLFSPVNPHALYFATNTIWKTLDGGQNWRQISPDLTRTDSVVPASVGKYATTRSATARHPGVVYTVAPSYLRESIMWAGSDDGLIHVTMNGGATWKNVTPPDLEPWAKVSLIDASHFDSLTAYAAINTLRLSKLTPRMYRTRDGGKTWTAIVTGLPDGASINAVREDPKRRGLLFAGSERAVFVSFDDGDHWQSLRLNMPVTSVRDLVIKDDDLVAGTHGRGFWILDDIAALRQINAESAAQPAVLFAPETATRVRWNTNPDTPLPPDEPSSPNPPDGAIIDYWLKAPASGVVTLEILDAAGTLIRKYASDERAEPIADDGQVPRYWPRPPRILAATAGAHRFLWDLKYPVPAGFSRSYPIAAVAGQTEKEPNGVWVMPGRYQARLTVDGRTYQQWFAVRMDPRVKTPVAALARQFALARDVDRATARIATARQSIVKAKGGSANAPLDALDESLGQTLGELQQIYGVLQGADAPPTTQAAAAVRERLATLTTLERRLAAAIAPGGAR